MNKYVTDANVVFSGLISGKATYIDLATDSRLYLPDFALVELQDTRFAYFTTKLSNCS